MTSKGLFRTGMIPCVASVCLAFGASKVIAEPIEYTVRLEQPQTQMVDIEMRIRDVHVQILDIAMPTWRPGRYEILDHAGSVREVEARSPAGDLLPIRKHDKSRWFITTEGSSEVVVTYRVWANELRDRTRHVDDTHAFLDGSSIFMYVPSRRHEPLAVTIEAPADWTISTGLESRTPNVVVAPDFDVLVDSPIEVGIHDLIRFDVRGVPHEIMIWGQAEYDEAKLVGDFTKIIEAQADIFGRMPYERYVFQIHSMPGLGGGTEHLNSTIMHTRPATFTSDSAHDRFLGLVSHEYFHTWNVKQFRPAGIHPYDYQRENYSTLFWVAEGTTSYYDDLTLARTELMSPRKYLDAIESSVRSFRDRPGRHVQSLEASSFDAWIKFNHSTADSANSTVSFYRKGALVNLMIDMRIREATGNERSLDDVMRAMFERFPLDGPGYTTDDFRTVIEEVAGIDFASFFEANVAGTEPLDLEGALAIAGLDLTLGDGGEDVEEIAYLGLDLQGSSPTTVRSVASDGPAYFAGLNPGDEVIALDGTRLTSSNYDDLVGEIEPGAKVTVTYMRYDRLHEVTFTSAVRVDARWTIDHVDEPTEMQKAVYESWLGRDWPE
ncbi:MAG: M61 family metallopeptidase [Phycisphaerales bacterium]|nr:M61 family metallopeptidase [Phycisphaerales bacterium]